MSKYYYIAEIQYEGSHYFGFQDQGSLKTIQAEINHALKQKFAANVSTMSASRTDTGVHAYQQFVKITSDNRINLESFIKEINSVLSPQIIFLNIKETTWNFRPNLNIQKKKYLYLFTNYLGVRNENNIFHVNLPYQLNLQAMNECIQLIKGKHNFCYFVSKGSNVKSTVREVFDCQMKFGSTKSLFEDKNIFKDELLPSECFIFEIEANGFLKQMIRHLLSALWLVGTNKLSIDQFKELLRTEKKPEMNQKWKVAPPNGLILYNVQYKNFTSE